MRGEQLILFEQPVVSRKLNNHLLKPVKLETIMPEIVPDKHVLYPTGGWHFFHKQVEKNSMYAKPIWPYITVQTGGKIKISSIYFSDATNYRMVSLKDKNHPQTCPKMMHVIVAKAYIWNAEPKKYYQVSHKGDDRCNYLPENLEWCTGRGNHLGKKNKRLSSFQDDYEMAKARGFIK